ncbi:rRNA methyltransferase 3A, mitochondrial isoform X1 [Hemitrygon akajei]|uniref:rRNA methyltransferase 3A, mitochondrial isoform X1 n=2 Tax=Hemitrygon akajei TaxID=2704970 RepID=UPI003BFA1858
MAALMGSVCRWAAVRFSLPPGPGRRYVRALRRRPIEIIDSRGQGAVGDVKRPRDPEGAGPRAQAGQQPLGPDAEPELSFERAFPGDKRLAKVMIVAKSKKFRDQHGKILLEGRRLITDALRAGAKLETLFFSNMDSLKELPVEKLKHAKLIKVKFEEIKMWSDLVTPQGTLGIFLKPEFSKMKYPLQKEHTLPLFLICDNIRDPGNLGTILRSAVAAGCSKILVTKGCVDVWEPKVLRAGMGAHFRTPVLSNLEWGVVPNYLSTSTCVHVADHSCPVEENPSVLPESLSTRDRRGASPRAVEYEESDSKDDGREFLLSLPKVDAQNCYQAWARQHTAIVIGGETHGLSLEALTLVEKTRGKRLYVPMTPGVDSLNSAMAACVLLFEGRRQLLFQQAAADDRTKMSSESEILPSDSSQAHEFARY